ncbi:TetR/AcrR family transcriptional regulator [Gordonia sp. DT30]|uniref:TetR/AcrR family transcriptional regulator n=1 Tax=unclassified Gordonia (in: high G+C Gram-positive bacteria) TaxID=2657482 RepID=UPI003CF09DC1
MATRTPASRERAAHLGPERRRPVVLDTALAIGVEHGVAAISIAAVATRMGVTRPVVYACYPDRDQLVEALLDREKTVLLGEVLAALHGARGDDPEKVFVDGYRALLTAVDRRPSAWRIIFDAQHDSEIGRKVVAGRRTVSDAATAWIAPAMRRWWQTENLENKLPALIELFMASCDAAVRVVLDETNDLDVEQTAALYGAMMAQGFARA